MLWVLLGVVVVLAIIAIHDVFQKRHTLLRNFPLIGRVRYFMERIAPKFRQYFAKRTEELPFNWEQRAWIHASSKKEPNQFGFGTDKDLQNSPNHLIVLQSNFPLEDKKVPEGEIPLYRVPCAKIMGGYRKRRLAFRPGSIVNSSGMSLGSLSSPAWEAVNWGCALAGALHNTGEGGIDPALLHGADQIWQIGTGYFGCRDENGRFNLDNFLDTLARNPQIKAIEWKISQGAKAGRGGILPGAKVTPHIAAVRGVPEGKDCISPAGHTAWTDVSSMLDFMEMIADKTGLPQGIKSAVGQMGFWNDLARHMASTGRAVDFIAIDGGEGGTGAAPLVFTDHVALPFKVGMSRVYKAFAEHGMHENVLFVGSGKLGFPAELIFALSLGCDMVALGREIMMMAGCIQAQMCQTGHCPTGTTASAKWLIRGFDPTLKSVRVGNGIVTLRKESLMVAHACGEPHPALIPTNCLEILNDRYGSITPPELFGYKEGWGLPSPEDQAEIRRIMQTL